ncbi:MAG: hypothetical protein IT562_16100 [Alphaproteobacteria bacterium]|nr:hypothetical protein [Alphaproteobacteria bacterium]
MACTLGATALLVTAGCTSRPLDILEEGSIEPNKAVIVGASSRTLIATEPAAGSEHGLVVPKKIVCAEPSPDAAMTISQALTASFTGAGQGKGITAQAAAQLGRSMAEGLVQMTERTASIQLLRDALHRACEAYANGALSDMSYSLVISQYGDLMVTLLTGELTAGAFGRQLASINGEASHAVGVFADDVANKQAKLDKAEEAQADAVVALNAAKEQVAEARKPIDAAKPGKPAQADQDEFDRAKTAEAGAQTRLNEKERAVIAARSDLIAAQAGAQQGMAKATATGAGTITAKVSAQSGDRLLEMYHSYMRGSPKGLFVACLSALDRPPNSKRADPALVEECKKVLGHFGEAYKKSREADANVDLRKLTGASDFNLRLAQIRSGAIEEMVRACGALDSTKVAGCMEGAQKAAEALMKVTTIKELTAQVPGEMEPLAETGQHNAASPALTQLPSAPQRGGANAAATQGAPRLAVSKATPLPQLPKAN